MELYLKYTASVVVYISNMRTMKCPSCNADIQDDLVIKAATSIIGARGRGACKARDPKKMSEAGKKGGWPKGRPRKKHVA
jgi:hypothetical protein